jgi:hypothetical protein
VETREQQALRLARNDFEWLRGWGANFSEVVERQAEAAIQKMDATLRGDLSESEEGTVIYRARSLR